MNDFPGHGRQSFPRKFSDLQGLRTLEAKLAPLLAIGFASPVRLHLRTDLHLARKTWHLVMGVVIAWIYWNGMSVSNSIFILSSVLIWDVGMELARLRIPSLNSKILRVWGPVMRASELNKMSAIPHYLLASIFAIAIFPKLIAVLSILYLACGDPIASLVGILYGKHGIRFANGKSLIGTAAGVACCGFLTALFLRYHGVSGLPLFAVTATGAVAGGTAELLPFEMDDNFTIPMISGFMLWVAFIAFGL